MYSLGQCLGAHYRSHAPLERSRTSILWDISCQISCSRMGSGHALRRLSNQNSHSNANHPHKVLQALEGHEERWPLSSTYTRIPLVLGNRTHPCHVLLKIMACQPSKLENTGNKVDNKTGIYFFILLWCCSPLPEFCIIPIIPLRSSSTLVGCKDV